MARAIWNDVVLAESGQCQNVEGNVYFPPDAVNQDYLRPSQKTSYCGWKGTAHYFDVVVNDNVNKDAAWFYPEAMEKAKHIEGHVAFWNGVTVEL